MNSLFNKFSLVCGFATATTMLFANPADPQVTNVKATQDSSRTVTITYDLDEAAIVTMDVLTNGVSIGGANVRYVTGDCNQIVAAGTGRQIKWSAHQSWPGQKFTEPVVSFRVKAWAKDAPPDVMVVDLTASGGAGTQKYYESLENLPGGLLGNDIYRKSLMVMRRIHAADVPWTMGNVTDNLDASWNIRNAARETAHTVTLPSDYYMAVFEVTQKQWQTLTGGWAGYYTKADCREMRPVENVTYAQIRGADYPTAPADGSFVKVMRTKTGFDFDLPSEAQWEFACRAGTGEGVWNTGVAYKFGQTFCNTLTRDGISYFGSTRAGGGTDPWTDVNMPGRWISPGNNWGGSVANIGTWTGSMTVGSYAPNAWGLYDMHGNVFEVCLDKFVDDITANTQGEIVTTGSDYAARGGSSMTWTGGCRSSARDKWDGSAGKHVGVRLMCPIAAN